MNFHKYFHWAYYNLGKKHAFNFGTGLFIWLFLALAQPFGVYDHNLDSFFLLIIHLLPFGFLITIISYFVDFAARGFFNNRHKKDVKLDSILWLLKLTLLVHAFYVFREIQCDWQCFDVSEYVEQWFASILMVGITYIPLMLYGKFKYYHSMVGKDQNMNHLMEMVGSGNEKLLIDIQSLVFLKADDNYVDFIVMKSNGIKTHTLRATLKSLEEQLVDYPQFLRTHRSYIVNIQFVVSWRSSSLHVRSGEWSEEIPISSSYKNEVMALVK